MRTVIYARFSSAKQNEQSIEGQVRVCKEFCKTKGLTLVKTYADRKISGRTDARPEFQKMIADAKKNVFDAVVVYKTDRFARDKYDAAIYKGKLKKSGIQIFYAAESIPDGPEGIILESLMEGLAEYYSAELAQKVERGMRESALKCQSTGGDFPIGFMVGSDKRFIPDPKTAPIVQKIFADFIAGKKYSEIIANATALGARTRHGNPLNFETLKGLLRNEKYTGVYLYKDIRIEGGMPEIVSRETYLLAQAELTKRRPEKKMNAKYRLSGKLYCELCGAPMHGVSGTGRNGTKYFYYQCPNARKKLCTKKHAKRDEIEHLAALECARYILAPEIRAELISKLYGLQTQLPVDNTELDLLKAQQKQISSAISNIIRAIEESPSSISLIKRLTELEQEAFIIEQNIAALNHATPLFSREELDFLLGQVLDENPDRILQDFISEVRLYDDKMAIVYNISDNNKLAASEINLMAANVFEHKPEWLPLLDSNQRPCG